MQTPCSDDISWGRNPRPSVASTAAVSAPTQQQHTNGTPELFACGCVLAQGRHFEFHLMSRASQSAVPPPAASPVILMIDGAVRPMMPWPFLADCSQPPHLRLSKHANRASSHSRPKYRPDCLATIGFVLTRGQESLRNFRIICDFITIRHFDVRLGGMPVCQRCTRRLFALIFSRGPRLIQKLVFH